MADIVSKELSFESCTEHERIFVRIIGPSDEASIKGIVQFSHGMAEHSLLYVEVGRFLAEKGFLVAVNDHLGHGKSVSTGGAYGYFGRGGCQNMVRDMHKLYEIMHGTYPELSYILVGHSMGSFLARSYTVQYGKELAAAVYLGTGCGPARAVLELQKRFADGVVKKKGALAHDPLFPRLSTERFNKAFAPNRTDADWLSRDEGEVDRYVNDPLCGFPLTVSGYRDVLYLQSEINGRKWYESVPDIPILIMSGDQDPVGDFGKGDKKVADGLRKTGHDVKLILYPGARHVVLCETNKEEVYQDLVQFIDSAVSGTIE